MFRVTEAGCQQVDRTKDDTPAAGVGKQFLAVNIVPAPHASTGPESSCVPNSSVVNYYPHSPDGGVTTNYWKVYYDGRVDGQRAYRFIVYNVATGKYDIDRGTYSTMCPTPPSAPGQPASPPRPPEKATGGPGLICWYGTMHRSYELNGQVFYERTTFSHSVGEVWYGNVIQHFFYYHSRWNGTAWVNTTPRPTDYVCNNYAEGGNWPWSYPPNVDPYVLP